MSKTERLEEFFNFTEDDLKGNRKGFITEDQQLVLKEKTWRETNLLLITFVGIAIIYAAIAGTSNSGSGSMMIPALLGIIAVVVIIVRGVKRSDQSVHSVEGEIEFFWEEHKERDADRPLSYQTTAKILKMIVGEKTFQVRDELMNILDQGDNCRFYYTSGGVILSAEILDSR
jgi:hypothetical protein